MSRNQTQASKWARSNHSPLSDGSPSRNQFDTLRTEAPPSASNVRAPNARNGAVMAGVPLLAPHPPATKSWKDASRALHPGHESRRDAHKSKDDRARRTKLINWSKAWCQANMLLLTSIVRFFSFAVSQSSLGQNEGQMGSFRSTTLDVLTSISRFPISNAKRRDG